MKIDLTGKNVLVTGASRGIGAAIAQQLMASGATVALHYHKNVEAAAALLTDDSPDSILLQADLADAHACKELFEAAENELGRIHVLVNNAGIAEMARMESPDAEWLETWERTLAVNLTAAAILSRCAVAHFAEEGGGRLIHIASRAAIRGDQPDYLAYAASKGGMVALHRSIARGYGKQNIQSFLLAPGFVRTDMAQDFFDEYGEEYALNDIALPELTEPRDLAPLVTLLASGLADHATGATIDVNAGSYVH